MSKRYVSVDQLAERYSVAHRTIWRWSKNGTLPEPVRMSGACTRWDLAEVEAKEAERAADRGAA